MKVIFTGTGTSQGIPVIGCRCSVCTSANAKDQRLRSAAVVLDRNITVGIDVGPDFRTQMLKAQISSLNGILITHNHNDHIAGIDDVRPFNFKQKKSMALYGLKEVNEDIRIRFQYIFGKDAYPGRPQIKLIDIEPFRMFKIGEMEILPLLVYHGKMEILGFRMGDFSYITDAKTIPYKTRSAVAGSKTLVLNALHHRSHQTHLNLQEAIEIALELGIKKTYFTHISHHMGLFEEVDPQLPPSIGLAYDGLILNI